MAQDADETDKEPKSVSSPSLPNLVVVGSSAGGIEALSTLVSTLPADFPAPIVLAQHLDPRHASHLQEILARKSTLPVRTVVDEEPLQPGVVYVVPADRHVEITDHEVRLIQQADRRPKPSIDLLLSSAANVFGERLIAVILTGTGSDGASGAHAVKAAGGTVIIEDPETASYAAMPASLAPTTVDLVADLRQIGPLLYDLLTGNLAPTRPEADAPLQAILDRVREHNGIDFTHYKRPTIERRLQRRLHATGHAQVSDYLRYLQNTPEEFERLIASFLVKVTEFFRDADLFDVLRGRVVPDLIAWSRRHGNELRIWSAGCATGEEAYSLAILVAEALGEELSQFNVQIFATDLDEEAVAFARRGVYPAAALAGLPPELIARYFSRMDGTYEVSKLLRGQIVFGQHDLGQRAPFPRIDLVLCRNVLIYFVPVLQQRALQLFAFALRDGGYLALGKAEHVKPLDDLFVPAHEHLKLYRRQGERVVGPVSDTRDLRLGWDRPSARRRAVISSRFGASPPHSAFPVEPVIPLAAQRARTRSEDLGNLMLDLAVGVVVIDRNYDIQSINRPALRLLGIYKEALGKDLIHLTTSIPSDTLRAVIDSALQSPLPLQVGSETTVLVSTQQGEQRQIQLTCYPRGDASANPAAEPARRPRVDEILLIVQEVANQQQDAERTSAREQADRQRHQDGETGDVARASCASWRPRKPSSAA